MPPTTSLARRPSYQSSPVHGAIASGKGKGRAITLDADDEDDDDDGEVQVIEPEPRVWEVNWRNVQHKKHKTWEEDGVLVLKGTAATLRDENGKSLGTSTHFLPLHMDDEIKVGSKEVLIQDPLPYATFLTRFGYLPSTAPAAPVASAPRVRVPPATVGQKLVPSAGGGRSQGFKPLRPLGSGVASGGRRMSAGEGGENRPPRMEKREKWEMDLLIDGSSPAVVGGGGGKRARGGGESEGEGEAPRKVSPSVGRKERVPSGVEVMELDDDEEEEVQVVQPGPSKFKPLTTSASKPNAPATTAEDTHCYLCMWRKPTTKKNLVWDGDGVLVITGRKVTLKDQDTGATLSQGNCSGGKLAPGDQMQIGKLLCEVESRLPLSSYLNGSCFLKGRPTASFSSKSILAPPAQLTTSISSTSFFAPPALVKPKPGTMRDPVFAGKTGSGKKPEPRWDPEEEGAVVMKRPTKEGEEVWNKKKLPVVDVVIDPLLSKVLREHQKDGIKFMYECVMGMRSEGQGCILADEMGLGKTIQGIALIWTLLKQNPYWGGGTGVIERAMIVCPVTLVKNWATEIRKWLGRDRLRVFAADQTGGIKAFCVGKNYQVLIIGYEKLRTVVDDLKSCQPPIGLVICDEGHRLKSSGAKVTKALKSLNCKRRIIMSGTPIQNDLSEYHTMVDFINPGCLDTYPTFKKVFENAILKSREPNASTKDEELGTARSDQLARISQAFMLRRTGDVISKFLPPKLEYTVFIMPTAVQLAIYAKILEGNAVRDVLAGAGGGNAQQLSVLNVLKKLCNTPGLLMQQVKEGKGLDILRSSVVELLDKAGNDPYDFALSGKMLALGSLLSELRKLDEKIVVVSSFTSTLDIIERHCRKNKHPLCRLDGKTDQKDRISIVNGFNRGPTKTNFVFLLSSKSGGTGLNIIGASRLVLIDSDWNPSTDLQAMARIHREGQKKQCVIYRFLTSGTMDEKIFQRQTTKLGLSGSLMDNESVGGASKGGDVFTISDLRNIFKHHPGVACQTHELLGCRCHEEDGQQLGSEAADEDEEEDDDEPIELGGFEPASQYAPEEEKPEKQRLSALNRWNHINCTSETSVDSIQDQLLRAVVYERVIEAEDEEGFPPLGDGSMRLRGGQLSMVFELRT